MYEQIKQIIKNKKPTIDDESLRYFTNYFYVLNNKKLIPNELDLETIIDNTLYYSEKIVFFKEDHPINDKLGHDFKGKCDSATKTLYIRDSLDEPLKEMVIYHEIHHAAQTNRENNYTGINQSSDMTGNLVMEAQTEWFAEEIYKEIHGVTYEDRHIKTEDLNMAEKGVVVSQLHNYELYDAMLSKLAILLDVSKDFFVSINFLYKDNKGLKILEKKYNEKQKEKKLPYSFEYYNYLLDYIYTIGYMAYANNQDKAVILGGGTTTNGYFIHGTKGGPLSLELQRKFIDELDRNTILALIDNGLEFTDFAKYIVDNEMRNIIAGFELK